MTDELKRILNLMKDSSPSDKEIGDIASSIMKAAGIPAALVDAARKSAEAKEEAPEVNNAEMRAEARAKAKHLLVDILGIDENDFNEAADKTDAEFERRERIAKGEEEKSGFDKFVEAMAAAQNKSEEQLKDEMSSTAEEEVNANVDMLVKCFVRQIKECPSIVPNGLTERILEACEEEGLNAFIAMKALCNTPFDVIATK